MADLYEAQNRGSDALPDILTKRLRLHALRTAHAEALFSYLNCQDVMRWSVGPVKSLDGAEQWIKHRTAGAHNFMFAISLRGEEGKVEDQEEIIGTIGSYEFPSVGYGICPGM